MKNLLCKNVLTIALVTLLFSCSKSSSSYGTDIPPTGSTSNKISIINMSFTASVTTVDKGTTITWTNNDNSFASSNLNKGDTYMHTFNTAGTFTYHCSIHSYMTGSVVVK